MNKIIADLPINTLEEIFSADESTFPTEVREILQWKGVEAYFNSQGEEDALTRVVYGCTDKDGLVRFPAATDDVFLELFDKIGSQISSYHQETIEEHLQMVFHYAFTFVPDNTNFLLMALLHDCGKKWTAGTNKAGELCFHGHEKLSALVANSYLKQMGVCDKDRERIVTRIFYHMRPKAWERMEKEAKKKSQRRFISKHGEALFWEIYAFSHWDQGVTEVDDEAQARELFRLGKEEALRLRV